VKAVGRIVEVRADAPLMKCLDQVGVVAEGRSVAHAHLVNHVRSGRSAESRVSAVPPPDTKSAFQPFLEASVRELRQASEGCPMDQ